MDVGTGRLTAGGQNRLAQGVAGLLPGRYVLRATFLGYEPHADTLALDFEDRAELTIALHPDEAELEAVTVESEGPPPTAAPAGFVRVRPADLAAIPAPDLSADLAGFLTVQPGITTVGDRGGQLYVRGGTPTQNLVLVDGMRLFQPFHIVGFYSAFPAEIVQQADVYAGGFGARYGGRISSVIDVQTRNGSKRRFGGAASIAPFLTALRVEGPIVRDEASFLLSVRESVVERVAEQVVGEPLPYRFGDAFGKVHFFTGPASFVTLTGLRTTDAGTISGGVGAGVGGGAVLLGELAGGATSVVSAIVEGSLLGAAVVSSVGAAVVSLVEAASLELVHAAIVAVPASSTSQSNREPLGLGASRSRARGAVRGNGLR